MFLAYGFFQPVVIHGPGGRDREAVVGGARDGRPVGVLRLSVLSGPYPVRLSGQEITREWSACRATDKTGPTVAGRISVRPYAREIGDEQIEVGGGQGAVIDQQLAQIALHLRHEVIARTDPEGAAFIDGPIPMHATADGLVVPEMGRVRHFHLNPATTNCPAGSAPVAATGALPSGVPRETVGIPVSAASQ